MSPRYFGSKAIAPSAAKELRLVFRSPGASTDRSSKRPVGSTINTTNELRPQRRPNPTSEGTSGSPFINAMTFSHRHRRLSFVPLKNIYDGHKTEPCKTPCLPSGSQRNRYSSSCRTASSTGTGSALAEGGTRHFHIRQGRRRRAAPSRVGLFRLVRPQRREAGRGRESSARDGAKRRNGMKELYGPGESGQRQNLLPGSRGIMAHGYRISRRTVMSTGYGRSKCYLF